MILQKRNSGRQWRWGCSDFELLASVAIERPAKIRSAKAISAILHSVLIVRLIYNVVVKREHDGCHYRKTSFKHSFRKCFFSVPVLATLFDWILLAVLNIIKLIGGNYQRAETWKKDEKMELRTLLENHQKIKTKETFMAMDLMFTRLNREMKSSVLFFLALTIHFYRNHD